jgi:hypothetical protein
MPPQQRRGKAAAEASPATPGSAADSPTKEWRPENGVRYAPVFVWPPQPVAFARWLVGWPGFLAPWNAVYVAIAVATHAYTQPELSACAQLSLDWIGPMLLRNMALLWAFAGGWHVLLHMLRVNGTHKKYDPAWPATGEPKFMFGDQVRRGGGRGRVVGVRQSYVLHPRAPLLPLTARLCHVRYPAVPCAQVYDNIFWSCASGVPIWTAYEVGFMYAWAHGWLPGAYFDFWSRPGYSLALWAVIPLWREFHFYFVHRLIHWKPLYRAVHYLHHKNVNPIAWSGMAMHPVEHLLYFSVLLIHAVVPSHPLHVLFNAQHTALTPAGSHHGFEGPVWGDAVPTGSYFHYLHHR